MAAIIGRAPRSDHTAPLAAADRPEHKQRPVRPFFLCFVLHLVQGAGVRCDMGGQGGGCCLSVRGGSSRPGTGADLYGCAQPAPPFKNQQVNICAARLKTYDMK
jgi:hypothetical protein